MLPMRRWAWVLVAIPIAVVTIAYIRHWLKGWRPLGMRQSLRTTSRKRVRSCRSTLRTRSTIAGSSRA